MKANKREQNRESSNNRPTEDTLKTAGVLAVLALVSGCQKTTVSAHEDTQNALHQQFVAIQGQMADLDAGIEKREEYDLTHGFRLALENSGSSNAHKRKVLIDGINEIRARHHLSTYESFEDWAAAKD